MKRLWRAAIAAFCIATPAYAQVDTTRAARTAALPPGTLVRVLYDSRAIIGRIHGVSADAITVDSTPISFESIDRVQLRERSTRRGLKIGAIVGAPAGAAFGAFVVFVANIACEYDCSDIGAGDYVLGTLGGAAFGTLAGALVGATIGAAIPRWVDIERARTQTSRDNFGSVSVAPVYGHGSNAEGGGLGVRANYIFQTKHVGFGPELGRYATGDRTRAVFRSCIDRQTLCQDTVTFEQNVAHGGAIARFGTGSDRTIEPYGTLGFGLYSWSTVYGGSIQFGGYSAGAGLAARSSSGKHSAFIDARYHNNLTRSGETAPQYGFFTVGLGGALTW